MSQTNKLLPKIQCHCACGRRHHHSLPCKSQTFEIPLSPAVLSGAQDLTIQVFLLEAPLPTVAATTGEQCEIEPFQPPEPVCTSQFSAIHIKQHKATVCHGLNDNDGNLNAASPIQWTSLPSPSASVERYLLHVNTLPSQIDSTKPAELFMQFWRTCQGGKTKHQQLSRHCAQIVQVTDAEP